MLINAIEPEERTAEARLIPQNLLRETPKSFDFNALACNRTRFGLQIKRSDAFSVPKLPVIDFIPSFLVRIIRKFSLYLPYLVNKEGTHENKFFFRYASPRRGHPQPLPQS